MKYVMRVIASASTGFDTPAAGKWVQSFNHDGANGRGTGVFTEDPRQAMTFDGKGQALAFWTRQSIVRPRRPDGKPNKPLTAFTIEVEAVDDTGEAVMNNDNEDFEDFNAELADVLCAAFIELVMQRDPSRARTYEALFALASTAGVILEATGENIENTRPWFENMVTCKIVEAKMLRTKRKSN